MRQCVGVREWWLIQVRVSADGARAWAWGEWSQRREGKSSGNVASGTRRIEKKGQTPRPSTPGQVPQAKYPRPSTPGTPGQGLQAKSPGHVPHAKYPGQVPQTNYPTASTQSQVLQANYRRSRIPGTPMPRSLPRSRPLISTQSHHSKHSVLRSASHRHQLAEAPCSLPSTPR